MSDEEKKSGPSAVARTRDLIARVIGWVCLFFGLLLIIGALLIALDANRANDLVTFVLDSADKVDFGVFDRNNGVLKFDEGTRHAREVKNALVNWGLAGIVWLILGRVLSRIVRG